MLKSMSHNHIRNFLRVRRVFHGWQINQVLLSLAGHTQQGVNTVHSFPGAPSLGVTHTGWIENPFLIFPPQISIFPHCQPRVWGRGGRAGGGVSALLQGFTIVCFRLRDFCPFPIPEVLCKIIEE